MGASLLLANAHPVVKAKDLVVKVRAFKRWHIRNDRLI